MPKRRAPSTRTEASSLPPSAVGTAKTTEADVSASNFALLKDALAPVVYRKATLSGAMPDEPEELDEFVDVRWIQVEQER